MFTISVETYFRASHQLTLTDGSKESSHFHKWLVTANISSSKLNNMGIAINFHKLRALLDNLLAEIDNTALESVSHFQQNNPTAENVAKYIYDKLKSQLPKGTKLKSIKVVEEPGCSAKYSE
jgi:6-pyruvoyltetrahydropterin/6-carboxytetrahydropterin synthase